jgi:hypothetical protein
MKAFNSYLNLACASSSKHNTEMVKRKFHNQSNRNFRNTKQTTKINNNRGGAWETKSSQILEIVSVDIQIHDRFWDLENDVKMPFLLEVAN